MAWLEAAIDAARSGPGPSSVTLPDTAETIDGVRYEFRPDASPLEWFTLAFGDETARLTIEGLAPDTDSFEVAVRRFEPVDGPIEAEIGLNGRFVVGEVYGLPAGWRGQWVADDTFVAEFRILGRTNDRGTFQFTFEDGSAQLRFRELEGVPQGGRRCRRREHGAELEDELLGIGVGRELAGLDGLFGVPR